MKQLSSLKFSDKQFTVQTEIVHKPEYEIRSLVYYSGKVLFKKETPISEDTAREELENLVERQHIAAEEDVKARVSVFVRKRER